MEQFAGPMLQPVEKWVMSMVEECFSYVFSNKKHIDELDKELKNLEYKTIEIGRKIEEVKGQGETVIQRVDDWQKEADEIIKDSQNFLEKTRNSDAACFFKLCCNVVHLYKTGKEAAMLHKKVADKYQDAMNIGVVATPPPPAAIVVSSAATSGQEFRSREKILDEVISALQDENIDVVGIHGMGGVGKTTLVDKLILQAREQKLFNVVAKAVVSKTPNIKEIQSQIADRIKFTFHADSMEGRVDELNQVLSGRMQNNGKILLILDDIWKPIDITTQIGIPRMKCCKVVITSRITDILRSGPINACRLFEVGVLEDEEAELLFVKSLGKYYSTIANDSQFTTTMKDLLKRCGGLPLALVTLAGALKGKDHHIWMDAIDKLSKHCGRKIEEMSEKVWSTIMFSFDSLQNEEVKKVLLLCSLFPEDVDIPMLKLVSYGFGIDLFDDSCKLDEAMRQVHGFIDKLVSCSLLLSAEINRDGSYCVRVHDVIRDVAMDIASQDQYNFFTGTSLPKKEGLVAVSLSIGDFENMGGHLLDVSKLRVLRLQHEHNVCISNDFFKGMDKLKVLDLVVDKVGSFSIFDDLTNLEHLYLESSSYFTPRPSTFEGFKYLKVLDVSGWNVTKDIPANFLAGLFQLEGLLLADYRFINIAELQWCPRLRILRAGLKVTTGQQIPQEVASNLKHLSSFKLGICTEYSMKFTQVSANHLHNPKCLSDKLFPKTLLFDGTQGPTVISIIDILPKGLHSLRCFHIDDLTDLKMVDPSMLKELVVENCADISCLFGADVGLSKLEFMSLSRLPQLEGICELKHLNENMFNIGTSTTLHAAEAHLFPQELRPTSFSQLRVLKISMLPPLTSVFPSLTLYKQTITTLRELHIECCGCPEVIASAEGDEMDVDNPITLNLETLHLSTLWGPFHFYKGKHTLKFPHLQEISVIECVCITSLPILSKEGDEYSRLEKVLVSDCKDMKYVFAADVKLSKLRSLKLWLMPNLEEICRHNGGALWRNSFPALSDLYLWRLPKIMSNITNSHEAARKSLFGPEDVLPSIEKMVLCEVGCVEIWPFPFTAAGSFSLLRFLKIDTMPHLKYLFPSLAFCTKLVTRLEELTIWQCENLEVVVSGGDEQVVDKDVANLISVIPALDKIRLHNLPKLKHFYGGGHRLKIPLLRDVKITECIRMELFATTPPDTPSLTDVNSLRNQPSAS